MKYYSTKTYGHDRGLSCAFRQPNASHSHCSLIHGYALAFKFTFVADELDDKNWVQDFGGLKELKTWLEDMFDHTLAIDTNDPFIEEFKRLEEKNLVDIRIMDGVGCEKFAEHAFVFANELVRTQSNGRVEVVQCEVMEHGANSAIVRA